MPKLNIEKSILQAALEGLEAQRSRIDEQIRSVRAALGGRTSSPKPAAEPSSGGGTGRRSRELSSAARARIAAAQKKRWAEYRKNKASQQ
jgi:hypothetical protein